MILTYVFLTAFIGGCIYATWTGISSLIEDKALNSNYKPLFLPIKVKYCQRDDKILLVHADRTVEFESKDFTRDVFRESKTIIDLGYL
ncbi:MAG: hypothetical protein ACTSQY_11395 [Candidatus Odinarchaeia archaeon]